MDAIIGEIYESGEPFSVFGDKRGCSPLKETLREKFL